MKHWFHQIEIKRINDNYYVISECLTCLNKVVWKTIK